MVGDRNPIADVTQSDPWEGVAPTLRAQGQRWTPQRRTVIGVLRRRHGHVTVPEVVDECRAADPQTTPSTVYRTLEVLERLGLVRQCHAPDGREEYHVLPGSEHGHLYCAGCGRNWEIEPEDAEVISAHFRGTRDFAADLSQVTIGGWCGECGSAPTEASTLSGAALLPGAAGPNGKTQA